MGLRLTEVRRLHRISLERKFISEKKKARGIRLNPLTAFFGTVDVLAGLYFGAGKNLIWKPRPRK